MFFNSPVCELLSEEKCLQEYPYLTNMLSGKERIIFRVPDFLLDSRKYCQEVTKQSSERSTVYQFNTKVKSLEKSGDHVIGVNLTDGRLIPADVVVLCCALWTASFKTASNIQMLPMRGASLDLHGCEFNENLVQISDYTSGDLNFQFCPFGKQALSKSSF